MEVDEGMFFQGLQAAAWRVPFLPTRAGLGSDVLSINPDLKLVRSPYGAGSPYLHDAAEWEAVAQRYVYVGDDEYRAHVDEWVAS